MVSNSVSTTSYPIPKGKSKKRKTNLFDSRINTLDINSLIGHLSIDLHSVSETTDVDSFRNKYLLDHILSKYDPQPSYDDAPPSWDLKDPRLQKAIMKLENSERLCERVNTDGISVSMELKATVRELILRVLGPFSYSILEQGRFSGGASTSRNRKEGHPAHKYSQAKPCDVTPGAYNLSYALITATPAWCVSGAWDSIRLVSGNNMTAVRKNADEHRLICKEPDLNMHMQKAVGDYIRNRLRAVGVDLNNQGLNQELARKGSVDNSYDTIDLSSASDLMSRRLILEVLPQDWHDFLNQLRSPIGRFPDGRIMVWEKFSSMGNGFTFELESLIFWAISKACSLIARDSGDICVYGDDIIVSHAISHHVCEALEGFGFVVNTKKSHTKATYFRESCGAHWYKGVDVKPIYIKRPIDTLQRCCWLLNRLRNWAYCSVIKMCDPRIFNTWRTVYRSNAPSLRLVSGGYDLSCSDSVVSSGVPRGRLVSSRRRVRLNGYGGYLQYMQSPIIGSDYWPTSKDIQHPTLIRIKSVSVIICHTYLFPQEV